jgi:hypothetical protein
VFLERAEFTARESVIKHIEHRGSAFLQFAQVEDLTETDDPEFAFSNLDDPANKGLAAIVEGFEAFE